MPGLEDLTGWLGDAAHNVGSAFTNYVTTPLQKATGSYSPPLSDQELPDDLEQHGPHYSTIMATDPNYDFLRGFRRSTQPKTFPDKIPVYRANERTGGLETLPLQQFGASPLKGEMHYWNKVSGGTKQAVRETYSYARIAGAAKALGLPTIEPKQFAAMLLKEGRPNAGFNTFTPQAKPDLEFRKRLDQYNIPEQHKDFLGMINYAHRVSAKKKVPFEAVWNGLGRSLDTGKTGQDYARSMGAYRKAADDPKNAQLVKFINDAYGAGAKYKMPTMKERARDIDQQYKSDPTYKYHKPRLALSAGGATEIDDGDPAKRRRLI